MSFSRERREREIVGSWDLRQESCTKSGSQRAYQLQCMHAARPRPPKYAAHGLDVSHAFSRTTAFVLLRLVGQCRRERLSKADKWLDGRDPRGTRKRDAGTSEEAAAIQAGAGEHSRTVACHGVCRVQRMRLTSCRKTAAI